jgi:polar amino acid transport system substrate-binding protein
MFKNATVKKFDGSALAGLELLNGHAQAVIHAVPWVAIYQRMNPTQTYAVLEPFTTEMLSVAVPKGNQQLVEYLNGFLSKYVKSKEYAQTYKYWFVTMDWWNGVPLKK